LPLVYSCITPHGSSIIEEIAGKDLLGFKPSRVAMEELGRRMEAHRPDTIIVATPHGMRLHKHIAVYTCEHTGGSLSGGGASVHADFETDKDLAYKIIDAASAQGLPAVGCNYGALSGPLSHIPIDWGVFIPMWYFGARWEKKPQIVVIGPTREIPIQSMVTLGEVVAREAEATGKRVAFVASADQGHAHDPNGPYGYDPAAKEYDSQICDIVKEGRLSDLLKMDLAWVDRAKPDSLWQMLMLYGASLVRPMKGEFLDYNLPSYFGMRVAGDELLG